MEWFVKPCVIKLGKIRNVVVSAPAKKLRSRRSITKCNNATGTIALCQRDGGRTVLNKETVGNIHIQPTGGFQMHSSLVRISTVIINNLILIEPLPESKGIKIKINIGFDGSTCQRKGNMILLQILHKFHGTIYKSNHIRATLAGPTIQILFMF